MKPFLFIYLALCWLIPTEGYAAIAGTILNVSHGFRMSSADPEPPKDYYIDLGTRDGLKDGDFLEVWRPVAIGNGLTGGPNHLVRVVLGEVKVLIAGDTASVARLQSRREGVEMPALEYAVFLIGDVVEAKTSLPFR